MKRLVVSVLAVVALLPAPALADQGERGYTTEFAIEIAAQSDLQHLRLPAEVYLASRHADLRDLAVLDAAGRQIAHRVQSAQAEAAGNTRSEPLAFYPLATAEVADPAGMRLRILRGEAATAIDLETADGAGAPRVAAYLIDRGDEPQAMDRLRLNWEAARGLALFHVDVVASDDLQSWRRLLVAAPLADLEFAGRHMRLAEIELPRTDARYLKLIWPAQAARTRLTGVEAIADARQKLPLGWFDAVVEAGDPTLIEFENPGQFRIAGIRFEDGDARFATRLRIESRARRGDDWRLRGTPTLYRIGIDGEILARLQARFQPRQDRYWRLRLDTPLAPLPVVQIAWPIEQLVFVANGAGPYRLTVGRATAAANAMPLRLPTDVLERLVETPPAQLGPARRLGDEPWWRRALSSPLLLWGMLVLGVLILAWMAVSLMRQLRRERSDRD